MGTWVLTMSATESTTKECVACAEDIKQNAKLCKHCGTSQDDPKFSGKSQASSVEDIPSGSSAFDEITFVIHFDCVDMEVFSAFNFWEDDDLLSQVIDSTEISTHVIPFRDPDLGTIEASSAAGDLDILSPSCFYDLLKGNLRYASISQPFRGQIKGQTNSTWPEIRSALLELRNTTLSAGDFWDEFDEAPVALSIMSLYNSTTGFGGEVHSAEAGENQRIAFLEYLDGLEKVRRTRKDIDGFLKYFALELGKFREGTGSVFSSYWITTEMALTQMTLDFGSSGYPILSVDQFDWKSPRETNYFVRRDRSESPESAFWFAPIPNNSNRELSDAWYEYDAAQATINRQVQSPNDYSPFKFAITMNALATFVEFGYDSDSKFGVEDFMEKHAASLNPLIEQIDQLEEDPIDLAREKEVSKLKFPSDAKEIWDDYLIRLQAVDS
jgi:hypothetical protein